MKRHSWPKPMPSAQNHSDLAFVSSLMVRLRDSTGLLRCVIVPGGTFPASRRNNFGVSARNQYVLRQIEVVSIQPRPRPRLWPARSRRYVCPAAFLSLGEPVNIRPTFVFLSLGCAVMFASASEPQVFTQQEFDQLTREGKPVVIDVTATWCPTCRAQRPIVQSLATNSTYKEVVVLTVDFDANKPILKEFRVGAQSTLIAFKGGKETARSVGDTTPTGIEALFNKTVN